MRLTKEAASRELLRRAALTTPAVYVPHKPHPKQAEFLAHDEFEVLFGGSAGGGKSDALLMAAAQYVHVPTYAALLLRRTYTDLALPGAIMDRAKSWWIPAGVDWTEKEKRFRFPSGATITFGYLDNENDKYRYQGAELQFVGVDELTQWPRERYLYMLSRLRRARGVDVPIRARSTSNPGGIGHDWVKRRFIDGGEPGAKFVPAGLADNPSLDREEYTRALDRLDPTLRQQLLDGIWVRDGSGLVYAQFDESRNVVSSVPKLTHYVLGMDFGIEDENAITVLGWREHDPVVYVLESYRKKALVTEMAEHAAKLEQRYHFDRIVGDTGGMGKAFTEEMRRRPPQVPVEAAEKQNKVGYIALLNGALADGRLKVHERCKDLIGEWLDVPWNETRTGEAPGFDDHAADSCLYAWRACISYFERPRIERPKPGSAEAIDLEAREMEQRAADESVGITEESLW